MEFTSVLRTSMKMQGEMIHYIAESRRQELMTSTPMPIFPLLLDGSTDKANIDNEVILVVWCDQDGTDEKVHT